jgi:predicted small lipoprotein YifL
MLKRVARFFPLVLACAVLALTGCGKGGPTPSEAQTAAPSEPTHKEFGEFEVHYNALRTDQLAPDVARAYGIERSANRVMLNVTLLRRNPDGSTTPVDGTVTASAYNLNGQLKDLQMRRITEGTSFYFIGEVGINGTEILVFDIDAVPGGQASKYSVQFKREFFSD